MFINTIYSNFIIL